MFSDSLDFSNDQYLSDSSKLIQTASTRMTFDGVKILQVVLKLDPEISLDAIKAILHFIYTGELSNTSSSLEVARNERTLSL